MTARWKVAMMPDCVGKQPREVTELNSLESPLLECNGGEVLKRCVLHR